LNTKDHLAKFAGKSDEGFFVGYSYVSNAHRVYSIRTRTIEESRNVTFNEKTPSVKGADPDWSFDLDLFTNCFYQACGDVSGTGSPKFEESDYMGSLFRPKKFTSKTVVQTPAP
jgi:hypothetical protein